jgi:outer membrane protein OmpA-like peptidoglycan-associated protein
MTMSTHGKYKLLIEGHTNPTVNPADIAGRQEEQTQSLQPLSEIRARAVFNELVKLGIDQNRLIISGLGGERPAAAWEDRDNWWMNRRVEFKIIE